MTANWQQTTLGKHITVKHGYAFKGEYITDEITNNILVTPGNFKIGGGFKADKFKYYAGEIPEEYILKTKKLIITMTDLSKEGDTLGYPALVPAINGKTLLHNQRIGLVEFTNDAMDKNYLYYLLCTREYQKYIVNTATGSTVRHTSPTRIQQFTFSLPPLPEQRAIAAVLSSFDDKIELLRSQNQTLEKIAQTLFKQWFTDFNFPNDQGKPYKKSGGKMVNSELGEIPEGWRVNKLGEIIDFVVDNRGKTPPIIKRNKDTIPVIEVNALVGNNRITDLDICKKYISPETYANWFRAGHPIRGDILISTVGSIGQITQVFDEKISIAQNIIALRSNGNSNFLYGLLQNKQTDVISIDISSVQPSIKVPHLLNIEIIKPPKEIITKFEASISPITLKIFHNCLQARKLSELKNLLLAPLISGKIKLA